MGEPAIRWTEARRHPRPRASPTGIAAAAAVWLLATGCGLGGSGTGDAGLAFGECAPLRRTSPALRRNLVVVLVDTLRRDRVGAYGGSAATPALDAFADRALRFDAASSQAPWTKPSVATLFSGLHPSQHGVVSHPLLAARGGAGGTLESDSLDDEVVTLAEDLASAGYQAAAIVANPWLSRQFGFAQGFELWHQLWRGGPVAGDAVNRAALAWLDARDDPRPYFLYLHYMDVHAPYPAIPPAVLAAKRAQIRADRRPVPEVLAREIAKRARIAAGAPEAAAGVPANRALLELSYDLGVERLDAALAELLAGLAARNADDELAVVVTSDHGEALFEHAYDGHGFGLYEEEIAVPLLARLPGVAGGEGSTSGCAVGLIDLRATLCDYLGTPCAADFGRSLFAPSSGPRYGVAEGVKNRARHRAVRGPRYKLIWQPDGHPGPPELVAGRGPWSLFDLVADPGEASDLLSGDVGADTRVAFDTLRAALPDAVADYAGPASLPASVDPATRRQLEALGYLGAK